MGAKYLPTIRDQKANQRFLRKQGAEVRATKPSAKPVSKPAKKK